MNNFEQFDETELTIKDTLDALANEARGNKYRGDAIYTKRIMELLRDLGWNLGFEVAPDKTSNPAWLFDLNWYCNNDEERLVRLPLVVECEWNRSQRSIRYDFEKLLCTNAEHRLMICQAKNDRIEGLYEYFEKAIQDYQFSQNGDRYLIAILDDYQSGDFLYKLLIK